ncbi:AraC family transcriptional regulator [Devosia sediminis]|uniref:AraC family transcriptional regulator n=1 Tax=Devosia sediminis TaxID=2798801 RepID=A0A934IXC4_9HYPH|nr:AraC family transcriptional regulator [Devosia sediminis]MBJ3783659.1 AraC family transcriptional regulator [Devosia sediminis]
MTTAQDHYFARMRRALDHIDQHLDDDLDLDRVSAVAAFSKFHFHRQFAATFGVTLHRYVQLARMQRAASGLVAADGPSVTEIAMDAGYDAPEAFARAFRQRVGSSPSSFRDAPDWDSWLAAFRPLDNARTRLMQIIFESGDVTITTLDPIPVAMLEHRGDRANLPRTFDTYRQWRQAAGLSAERNPTYMVFRSEREPAVPEDYSMDLCVGTDLPVAADDAVMKAGTIPGGRCAVLRYPGQTKNLEPAALYLYRDWLPQSGEEARDFPMFSKRYLALLPGAGVHEAVTEVYLPLK